MADQGDIWSSTSTSCGSFKGARYHGSASFTRSRISLAGLSMTVVMSPTLAHEADKSKAVVEWSVRRAVSPNCEPPAIEVAHCPGSNTQRQPYSRVRRTPLALAHHLLHTTTDQCTGLPRPLRRVPKPPSPSSA
jgi:hypothetical protein